MVSIIIPTCDKHKFLDLTFASLSQQVIDSDVSVEIIIVNDGKEEEVKKVIAFWDRSLKIRYYTTILGSKGRASARNTGANYATGEILIFIDDDMLLMPDLVQSHIDAHKESDNIMAIGYRYRLEQSTLELFNFINSVKIVTNIEYIKNLPSLLDEREAVYKMFNDDIEISRAPWVCSFSNNISIRKKHFSKHSFDEIFQKKWGIEDIEFGYRLYKHGIDFKLIRNAYAYHLPHATSWRRNLQELEENLSLFFNKFTNYEVELYVDHLRVGLLKYLESMKNIGMLKKNDERLTECTRDIIEFYKANIQNDKKIFFSGYEGINIIENFNGATVSALCENAQNVKKQINLIGSKTKYNENEFDCVIVGSRSNEVICPYFSLLVQEGYRIAKKVLFVIDAQGLKNVLEFFSISDAKHGKNKLKNLIIAFGIEEKEINITNGKNGLIFVWIIKEGIPKKKIKKANISLSLDLESPTEKTVSGLNFAVALYKQGANIHIQNTKKFVQYDEMDKSKLFINDSYVKESERDIVNEMLSNDLKLLTNDYLEIPVERFVNNTPKLILRVDEDIVGFPLNEKTEYINSEAEIIWHSSEYSKSYFLGQGGVAEKSFLVPYGVDTNDYSPFDNKNKKFVFMASGAAFKESGIDIVLKAFKSVFSKNNDVELKIFIDFLQEPYAKGFFQTDASYKIYMKFYEQYRDIYNCKVNNYKETYELPCSNIKIIISDFNVRNKKKYFQECDCYVHLYRNDFCGENILKAMSCEKPVIVIKKFLPNNLCKSNNSFAVKSSITSGCEHEYIPFSEYSLWAEPDFDDCKEKLLYVYNNIDIARQKGINARDNIIAGWTWNHSARKAIESVLYCAYQK